MARYIKVSFELVYTSRYLYKLPYFQFFSGKKSNFFRERKSNFSPKNLFDWFLPLNNAFSSTVTKWKSFYVKIRAWISKIYDFQGVYSSPPPGTQFLNVRSWMLGIFHNLFSWRCCKENYQKNLIIRKKSFHGRLNSIFL